jgi:hypothetical protein
MKVLIILGGYCLPSSNHNMLWYGRNAFGGAPCWT